MLLPLTIKPWLLDTYDYMSTSQVLIVSVIKVHLILLGKLYGKTSANGHNAKTTVLQLNIQNIHLSTGLCGNI